MNMKKYYILTIFGIMSLLMTGCSLELQPISEIGEGSYYKNASEINAAVVACYNGLQAPMSEEWVLTELRSDNTRPYNTVSTSTSNLLLFEFDQSKISATNSHVYDYWMAVYNEIARCNTVLKHIDVMDEGDTRNHYEGEARLLRAYEYFNLVRLFGPVFLVTERISAEQAKSTQRTTVAEVYTWLEGEFAAAADLLPDSREEDELGRVTSWVAKTMLADLYMNEGKYDETTLNLLKDVYTNSGFELEDNCADVFSIDNEMNKEILFAVRYTSGGIGLGSAFGNLFAPQQSGAAVVNGDGKGYNYPTSSITGLFSSSDTRKDVCLSQTYTKEDGTIVDMRYITKFTSPVTIKDDGDKDWPILRFSDVILLYAAVQNEVNGPEAARGLYNEVHMRAGLKEVAASAFANKYDMRVAIAKERRLEFAFENKRWYDLLRNNTAVMTINNHYVEEQYYEEVSGIDGLNQNTLLLPIPQKEIDVNTNITQNVGY